MTELTTKVFYKFDDEGFYLGTTGTECENSTEVPLTYESGYWYFWDKTENVWNKEKIPESVEDCASISIDYDSETTSNHTEMLLAVVRRIFATYTGEQYSFNTVTNTDTGHILYSVTKYSDEEIQNKHKIEEYQEEIVTLKKQLSNTDYKAIKYAEGMLSEEEYAEVKSQRQGWRDRINELEELINE